MNRGWALWPIGRTPLGAGIHPPGFSWKREQANGVQHTKSYNAGKQGIQEKLKSDLQRVWRDREYLLNLTLFNMLCACEFSL